MVFTCDVVHKIQQVHFILIGPHKELWVLRVLVKLQLAHSLELLGFQDESLKNFIVDQGTLLCDILILLNSLFFGINTNELDFIG